MGPDREIAPREMGQPGPDIRLVGGALHLFPFAVECKYQESWQIHQWIDQAKGNVDETVHDSWLIVAKRNRTDPVIIMDATAFFNLLGRTNGRPGGYNGKPSSQLLSGSVGGRLW